MNPLETNGNEPPEWAKNLIARVTALEVAIGANAPDTDPEDRVTKSVEQISRANRDASPAFDNMEARQAAYDIRNPHMKKHDQTGRAGL